MSYSVKVLCDSVAFDGKCQVRLTTLEVTMPRFILAEFNTHRVLSRNSASSRAIPVEKRISMVYSDPFIPEAFQANKKGMQAGETLDAIAQDQARGIWLAASASAVKYAKDLANIGVHKQWANRLLEPFAWQTVVCSATEWRNFLNLRIHKHAQPEIYRAAELMRDAMKASTPKVLEPGEWHMPFITEEDINESTGNPSCTVDDAWLLKLSTARCARVSYLTHDKNVRDTAADVALHDMLKTNGHMSPFEHCAQVMSGFDSWEPSNFAYPWKQYRKFIPNEAIFPGDN